MVTVWSKRARTELKKAYEYIREDSPQNAITLHLPKHPEKFPPDKFKKGNDNTWRAFEIYHYRISYRIMPDQIRIVRMRHTRRSPLSY